MQHLVAVCGQPSKLSPPLWTVKLEARALLLCGVRLLLPVVRLRRAFAQQSELFDLLLGQMLDPDEPVFGLADTDEFVELRLQSGAVSPWR